MKIYDISVKQVVRGEPPTVVQNLVMHLILPTFPSIVVWSYVCPELHKHRIPVQILDIWYRKGNWPPGERFSTGTLRYWSFKSECLWRKVFALSVAGKVLTPRKWGFEGFCWKSTTLTQAAVNESGKVDNWRFSALLGVAFDQRASGISNPGGLPYE